MKILNFTAVEVLPGLLNKTKTQSIRPAWKIDVNNIITHPECSGVNIIDKEKPSRFKVGEKVKLVWNQRSKGKLFCSECGNRLKKYKANFNEGLITIDRYCGCSNIPIRLFISGNCFDNSTLSPQYILLIIMLI